MWQPIETAPDLENIILFAFIGYLGPGVRNWRMETGHRLIDGTWVWGGQELRVWDYAPTHWQPLPEPPA